MVKIGGCQMEITELTATYHKFLEKINELWRLL